MNTFGFGRVGTLEIDELDMNKPPTSRREVTEEDDNVSKIQLRSALTMAANNMNKVAFAPSDTQARYTEKVVTNRSDIGGTCNSESLENTSRN